MVCTSLSTHQPQVVSELIGTICKDGNQLNLHGIVHVNHSEFETTIFGKVITVPQCIEYIVLEIA
jgi:hypothetical protein